MSIWTIFLNLMDLKFHAIIKKITLIIILGSIPHQKFCFYHLPTRGRAGIKLGDAWYVSNVSIIFYCSMLLYYLFWMFMGFTLNFYIIFGTNLQTGGPARIAVFLPISVFHRKKYQMESKRNETFGNVIFRTNVIQRTWSLRQEINQESTRQGARLPPGRALHPRGAHVAPPTYFFLLYIPTYPETIRGDHEKLFPPS